MRALRSESRFAVSHQQRVHRDAGGAVPAGLLVLLAKVLLDLAVDASVERETVANVQIVRVGVAPGPAGPAIQARRVIAGLDLDLFTAVALIIRRTRASVVARHGRLLAGAIVLAGL